MFYPLRHLVTDYIDYYRDIRTKYGKQYWNFDPYAIRRASSMYDDVYRKFRSDYRKANSLPKPDRIQVASINFPVSCGIQFSLMMAVQVQKQIEDRIGISDIHKIPATWTGIDPFF